MISTAGLTGAVINGLTAGMLLFLVAVGLNVIFGVINVINFAHGSFYMLGAYFAWVLVTSVQTNFWIAAIIAAVLVAILGMVIERVIIRPIYDRDHIFQLLLTFALVLVLDNAARIVWGVNFRSVQVPAALQFQIGDVPAYNVFLIVVGAIVAVSVWLMFERTRIGKTVRAASQDREISNALGVNVPFLYTAVFLGGAALAGFSGALAAPYRSVHPAMGESIILESFIVVVVGGIGSFSGALVGALLLGLLDSFAFLYVPLFRPIIPFILLAAVILLKPEGILGDTTA
jgi:branched-chain amino acid transport system permease protein